MEFLVVQVLANDVGIGYVSVPNRGVSVNSPLNFPRAWYLLPFQ
jgi:hypothetical protein